MKENEQENIQNSGLPSSSIDLFDATLSPKHPKEFNAGDIVQSIHTGKKFEIIIPDKRGMAKLKNLQTGKTEDWNACNNQHFVLT